MEKILIVDQKRFVTFLCTFFCIFPMILLSGCGDGSNTHISSGSPETGAAMLQVKWHKAPVIKASAITLAAVALDCEGVGVDEITGLVYEAPDTLLTQGDPWSCSTHSGNMNGIPVGQNRTFVILGRDANGNIIYQGQKTGIDIEARSDNDAGIIDAYPFVPSGLTATAVSTDQLDLVWRAANENVSAAGYRIYRDGVEIGTSGSPSFNDTGLIPSSQYCYTVSAYDGFGNESGSSNQACGTTETSDDTEAPSVPIGLTAGAVSASQIDLFWTASIDNVGVSGYRVYRDGVETGTSASAFFSDTALLSNTEHCYTVAAVDAAGNASAPSDQDCAMTLDSIDWYRDADEDGYGDPNDSISSENQPEGYLTNNTDCNDDNASVHPGAAETCDGVDNDCDGQTDEGLLTTYYRDTDGDGYGDESDSTQACSPPEGHVSDRTDCNDDDASIHPDAAETCDGIDNDCDGQTDEGLLTTYYRDADGDGYGDPTDSTQACLQPNGYVTGDTDCRDDLHDVNPGVSTDICHDNLDNDCNGVIDDNCPPCYPDLPSPDLVLTDKQTINFGSGSTTIYSLTVANLSVYPLELFGQSTAYPPCDAQESVGSRTVLEIYDSNHKLLSSEYCNFESPVDLETFDLYVSSGGTYPEAVYITLYDQECGNSYTSNLTVVTAPVQLSPPDGSVFDYFPRTTTVRWQPVAGASSYSVEIDCLGCCGSGWCTDLGQTHRIYTDMQGDAFTFDFVGAQPGRWRVWAVDSLGNDGPLSGWWGFEYLQ